MIKSAFILKGGEAFFSLDLNWKCIYVNEWAEKILNQKKEELLGLNLYHILPEASDVLNDELIDAYRTKQSSFTKDIYINTEKKWFQFSFIPHLNGIDIFLKDISREKQNAVEKELKEKRFSKAFESSPIALLIIDYNSALIVDVNTSFLNLFEFDKNHIVGKTINSLTIFKSEINNNHSSVCDLIKDESIYKYDIIAQTNKNKLLNIIFSSETLKINGDKQLLLSFIDITEKIKFQNLIATSEKWFRSIADYSPILIWSTDEEMNCNYINKTWKEFTGINEVDFSWQIIIHENDLKDFLSSFEKSYKLKSSFRKEFRLRNREGVFKWMYIFANPIIQADGKFKGFIGSCSDIDDKINESIRLEKLVEERTLELTQSLEKEKNLNDAKSKFVSLASHEFRTPLSSILSSIFLIEKYNEIIEKKIVDSEISYETNLKSQQKKHFDRIKKSINHLTNTLNDFLSIDQLEQGIFSVKKEKFDLKIFSKEIAEELKPILKTNQQIIITFTGDSLINQDKRILQNIYLNLLSNAIKYSYQNSKIYLTIQTDKKNAFIEIKDQGIGISIDEQKYIFTKFYRAENASNIQGTGLGLNIVKKYTELIDGSIVFQSALGKGSSFIISLPRNIFD